MSNKTPKAKANKTKWARNIVVTAFATALVLSILATIQFEDRVAAPPAPAEPTQSTCDGLLADNTCIPLERATTAEAHFKGLSNRVELKPSTGMLFEFKQPSRQCIWMKDMNFSLDIIWLNETKTITKLMSDVKPDTFPEPYCAEDTKYVIELNSGDAKNLNLTTGQKLNF